MSSAARAKNCWPDMPLTWSRGGVTMSMLGSMSATTGEGALPHSESRDSR